MAGFDRSPDQSDMFSKILSWPDQVERSFQAGFTVGQADEQPSPRALLFAGMGGSAIGGDLVAAIAAGSAAFPVIVHRGGHLPKWVSPEDRLFLVSYSGNTAETLDAAREAARRGVPLDLLSSGGKLAEWGEARGIPLLRVKGGWPPRSALGDLFSSAIGRLAGRGWVSLGREDAVETVSALREVSSVISHPPSDSAHPCSPFLSLFRDKLPMIYGTGSLIPVARRWANQLNENAKRPAHWGELPEMNHNEVVAYLKGTPHARHAALLFLVDPESPEDVKHRVSVTLQLAEEAGWEGLSYSPSGRSPLARMLNATALGDWLSYWDAIGNRIDPTPIPTIDALKAALEA